MLGDGQDAILPEQAKGAPQPSRGDRGTPFIKCYELGAGAVELVGDALEGVRQRAFEDEGKADNQEGDQGDDQGVLNQRLAGFVALLAEEAVDVG